MKKGKSVPIIDMTDKNELKTLPNKLNNLNVGSGDIVGIQVSPFHIKFVITVAEQSNLRYYWNIVIFRNSSSYSEDFIFDGCYNCLLVFYNNFIQIPNPRIKDHFCSLEEAKTALQTLVED